MRGGGKSARGSIPLCRRRRRRKGGVGRLGRRRRSVGGGRGSVYGCLYAMEDNGEAYAASGIFDY